MQAILNFDRFKSVNELIMKRELIIILVIAFVICACSTKRKPYMLTMFVMKYDKKGNPFYLDHKREPILAQDDTAAYYQALKIVTLKRIEESKFTLKRIERTIKFELKDGTRDIEKSFSPETIGRLTINFIKLHPEISIETVDAAYTK